MLSNIKDKRGYEFVLTKNPWPSVVLQDELTQTFYALNTEAIRCRLKSANLPVYFYVFGKMFLPCSSLLLIFIFPFEFSASRCTCSGYVRCCCHVLSDFSHRHTQRPLRSTWNMWCGCDGWRALRFAVCDWPDYGKQPLALLPEDAGIVASSWKIFLLCRLLSQDACG